jgi:hypothetical protein
VFNLETNTVVESCDVTFNEIVPCPCDVLESVGDKEIEESIFVDEELQGFSGDEDKALLSSTSSPEHVPTSTLDAEAPQATTSPQQQWRRHELTGRSTPSRELHLTFRRHIHLNRS